MQKGGVAIYVRVCWLARRRGTTLFVIRAVSDWVLGVVGDWRGGAGREGGRERTRGLASGGPGSLGVSIT